MIPTISVRYVESTSIGGKVYQVYEKCVAKIMRLGSAVISLRKRFLTSLAPYSYLRQKQVRERYNHDGF